MNNVRLFLGGAGRCAALNLKTKRLESVDCNEDAYKPLCELNQALNCVTEGVYDGEINEAVLGSLSTFGFFRWKVFLI